MLLSLISLLTAINVLLLSISINRIQKWIAESHQRTDKEIEKCRDAIKKLETLQAK